jgi:hypothetical protein
LIWLAKHIELGARVIVPENLACDGSRHP